MILGNDAKLPQGFSGQWFINGFYSILYVYLNAVL